MDAFSNDNGAISVVLTHDEALVLFEFLQRTEDNHGWDALAEHTAELRVFWDMSCELERLLLEPFQQDYAVQIAAARERVSPDQESG